MTDRDETTHDDSAAEGLAWLLGTTPLAERYQIGQTEDELGTPRCPTCRGVLVARQGRNGPYFHCLCPPKAAACERAQQHHWPGAAAAAPPVPLRETG